MPGIDPQTLVIVVSFQALLIAVVLAAMRTNFPRSIQGIGMWAATMPLFVVASVLFSLQHSHPFIHVILANGVFVLAMLSANLGMRRFYDLPLPPPLLLLGGFVGILGWLAWFTFVQPFFILRLGVMALVGAILFAHLAWLPFKHGGRSPGSIITSAAFGWTALSCLLRMGSVVSDLDRPSALLDLGALQAIYLASFNVSILIGSIGFILLINERLRNMLEYSASHDALTGVVNRGAFFRQATAAFERSLRQSRPLSVALLDLDHFKQINDQHGHAAGDRVLQDFCRSARAVLRPGDVLGRYGGEEFVLLLPDTQSDQAARILERLHFELSSAIPTHPYTVSIGLASMEKETANIDDLLFNADKALYQAKRNGRNRLEKWGS